MHRHRHHAGPAPARGRSRRSPPTGATCATGAGCGCATGCRSAPSAGAREGTDLLLLREAEYFLTPRVAELYRLEGLMPHGAGRACARASRGCSSTSTTWRRRRSSRTRRARRAWPSRAPATPQVEIGVGGGGLTLTVPSAARRAGLRRRRATGASASIGRSSAADYQAGRAWMRPPRGASCRRGGEHDHGRRGAARGPVGVEERIGGGGQATVYRGAPPVERGRIAAVKVVAPGTLGRAGLPRAVPARVRGAARPASSRPSCRSSTAGESEGAATWRWRWRARARSPSGWPGGRSYAAGGRGADRGHRGRPRRGPRGRARAPRRHPGEHPARHEGPWLADFGIARRDDATAITGDGPAHRHGRLRRPGGHRGRPRPAPRPTATRWRRWPSRP